MKYTRYDLKKEKGTKTFVLMIALVLVAAFFIGTAASKILMKNYNVSETTPVNSQHNVKNSTNAGTVSSSANSVQVKFTAVQGGMYKDKNNAEKEKNLLLQYGAPFTVEEDGKIRVFVGIYTDSTAKGVGKSLENQKVDSSNMDFNITKDSVCNAEIIEIVDANLQILNKVSSKDIQSIKTDQLKKWCSSLEAVNKSSKNFSVLSDLKIHIGSLPSQLSGDNVEQNYVYIYNMLKKIK